MRRTASSSRAIGTVPSFTWRVRFVNSPLQSLGTMYMSMPALSACGQSSLRQPGTWPCEFQSLMTNPVKPMRPFSTSVIRDRLPVCFSPFQLENDIITVSRPASMAGL